jgi:hypothetical protein
VTNLTALNLMNCVTPKVGAKHKFLFHKSASAYMAFFHCKKTGVAGNLLLKTFGIKEIKK